MEPVRPQVDAYVLDWITREPLKREWLFEQRDGTCRLMASLAIHLSETAPMWARAVAPFAEWTARALWSRRKDSRRRGPATPLTQQRRREAKGTTQTPAIKVAVRPQSLCRTCGKSIETGRRFCAACAVPAATEHIKEAARAGRTPAHSSEARAKQAETQRRHGGTSRLVILQPDTVAYARLYLEKIQPALASFSNSTIASRLGVSRCCASRIKAGKHLPQPRHWEALAELLGVTSLV